jgi:hypothetical protein
LRLACEALESRQDLDVVPDRQRFGVSEKDQGDRNSGNRDSEKRLEGYPGPGAEIRIQLVADE